MHIVTEKRERHSNQKICHQRFSNFNVYESPGVLLKIMVQ